MHKKNYVSIKYSKKIIGTVTVVGKRHLEVQIPNESKVGYCRSSDTTEFIKGNFKNYFNVGDKLSFILSRKQSHGNKIFLDYKSLHPEEIKYKTKPVSTASYHMNLSRSLHDLINKYDFKKQ